jgi:hypothetical protein
MPTLTGNDAATLTPNDAYSQYPHQQADSWTRALAVMQGRARRTGLNGGP